MSSIERSNLFSFYSLRRNIAFDRLIDPTQININVLPFQFVLFVTICVNTLFVYPFLFGYIDVYTNKTRLSFSSTIENKSN